MHNPEEIKKDPASKNRPLTEMERRYVLSLNEASAMCFVLSGLTPDDSEIARTEKLNDALRLYHKDLRNYITMTLPKMLEAMATVRPENEDAENSGTIPGEDNNTESLPPE